MSENFKSNSEMITKSEIEIAQQAWGDGLVALGSVYVEGGNIQEAAAEHVDNMYAYDLGPVLFKPTKASKRQFRPTREGAISYFVGGNPEFPEDHGFALQPWSAVRFVNDGGIDIAHGRAMGNYYFTGPDGNEVKVEYTFGYIRDLQGKLRINLHHSSLPYNPSH